MDFLQLTKDRFSLRKFDGRPLKDEDIEAILSAAKFAPTAKNLQPQKIFVLKSEASIEKLNNCTRCGFGTKTAFLICYDKNECWKRIPDGAESGILDMGIVATHMMLQATAIGAGTTMVMLFDLQKTVQEFDLPENIIPVCFLVAGYPAKDAEPSERHLVRKNIENFTKEI